MYKMSIIRSIKTEPQTMHGKFQKFFYVFEMFLPCRMGDSDVTYDSHNTKSSQGISRLEVSLWLQAGERELVAWICLSIVKLLRNISSLLICQGLWTCSIIFCN